MLLASACLPRIHHTVVIYNEPYRDGGYSANPALFPLLHESHSHDIKLILLSRQLRDDVGRGIDSIVSRIQELGFTTHLMREMEMLAEAAMRADNAVAPMARFHHIDSGNLEVMKRNETKMLVYAPFLEMLKEAGQQRAQRWLAEYGSAIGRRNALDWSRCTT